MNRIGQATLSVLPDLLYSTYQLNRLHRIHVQSYDLSVREVSISGSSLDLGGFEAFIIVVSLPIWVVVGGLSKVFVPREKIMPQVEEDIAGVKWEWFHQNAMAQMFNIVSLIFNVGLTVFSRKKILYGSFVLADLFAIKSVANWKYASILSKEIPCATEQEERCLKENRPSTGGPLKFRYKYSFCVLEASDIPEEGCAICWDTEAEKENPFIYFCSKHKYHKECSIKSMYLRFNLLKEVLKEAVWKPKSRKGYHNYSNGCYTHDSVKYTIEIAKEKIPSCPYCQTIPKLNHLKVQVYDRHTNQNRKTTEEWINAKVKIAE